MNHRNYNKRSRENSNSYWNRNNSFKLDQDTILTHHVQTFQIPQVDRIKCIEVVHQNINNKLIGLQATVETTPDPPGIENTETSELKLSHIDCESTNEESENEKHISYYYVKIENE